jgi:diguanylate cyclase (GGDEF)-like protein
MVERDELARRRALSVGHPSVFRRDARRVAEVASMTEGLEQRRTAAAQCLAEAQALLVLAQRRDDADASRLSLAEDRVHVAEDRLAAVADRAEAALLLQRSRRDGLTGAVQRDVGEEQLVHELARARRERSVLVVAFVDLDGLKRINDTHGHLQGDRLLQRCAHAWSGALRQGDYLARLGGDEFLVLLPGSEPEVAEQVARRILGAVPFNQTCSIGLATWDGEEAAYELIHRADQGMYAAKAAGGGRISAGPVVA